MYQDDFLEKKLQERKEKNALRVLQLNNGLIDFASNDYLGLAKNKLTAVAESMLGSTGSRLLSGNNIIAEETEKIIAAFHQCQAALLFNSGYDANIGLLSSVPQRGDTIIYDYLSHASIRDGIRLSYANSFSFEHNSLNALEQRLQKAKGNVFVVTESVFSMDGDMAPLAEISNLCNQYNAHLIVDEAHATGVIGKNGEGLCQQLNICEHLFARVHTFGKACGCHGAVILGSDRLKSYLINFARSLMYTTALPPHALHSIQFAYEHFPKMHLERRHLGRLINLFQRTAIAYEKLNSSTPIQPVVVPGNYVVKTLSDKLRHRGFDVRPILYPTVPEGKERLRIVLHAFNTENDLNELLEILKK